MKKFNYLILIVFTISVGVAGILMTLPIRAADTADPDTYVITLYKTELSTDGVNWVTVFDNGAIGVPLNLKNPAEAGTAFGNGSIPAGIYTNIRFLIKNEITFTKVVSSINSSFVPYQGEGTEVMVYFSNTLPGETASFTWASNGLVSSPFPLPDPIRVVAGATSKIIINFGVTNSLVYYNSTWTLNPPVISVSNVMAGSEFQGGTYYYIRHNLRIPTQDYSNNATITPTWLAMEAGWGTITFTPSNNPDMGTCNISDNSQRRFILRPLIGDIESAGQLSISPELITGRYYTDADGYLTMILSKTDGIIRGAIRSDGNVFVGIEITAPLSQTAQNGAIGNNMIYAIKKEANTQPGTPLSSGKYAYNQYMSEVITATDIGSGLPRTDLNKLVHSVILGLFDGETFGSAQTANTIEIERPLSGTQQVIAPAIRYSEFANNNYEAITPTAENTGQWDNWAAFLDDRSIFIGAGIVDSSWDWDNLGIHYGNNPTSFFVALRVASTGTWTTNTITGTYSFVYKNDYWEPGMGLPDNNVLLGRVTFNGDGTMSGRDINCRRGETTIEDLSAFKYMVVTATIGSAYQTDGVTPAPESLYEVDVIKMYRNNDPADVVVYLLISDDGLTLSPYSPATIGGIPNKERGLGLAVKQK